MVLISVQPVSVKNLVFVLSLQKRRIVLIFCTRMYMVASERLWILLPSCSEWKMQNSLYNTKLGAK